MSSLFQVHQLCFYSKEHMLLKNINLTLSLGQSLGIFGASGSGKSTLLKAISFFYDRQYRYTGEILLEGQHITAPSKKIILLQQNPLIFPHLPIYDQLKLFLQDSTASPKDQLIIHWAKRLQIHHRLACLPAILSGGEAQRVSLLRAILMQPKLLLLDEPFAHLDQSLAQSLQNEILQWSKETQASCIWVSHQWAELERLASNIMLLDQGECLQFGSPRQLLSAPQNLRCCELLGGFNVFKLKDQQLAIPQEAWHILKNIKELHLFLSTQIEPSQQKALEGMLENHLEAQLRMTQGRFWVLKVVLCNIIDMRYEQRLRLTHQSLGEFEVKCLNQSIQLEIGQSLYLYHQKLYRFNT